MINHLKISEVKISAEFVIKMRCVCT